MAWCLYMCFGSATGEKYTVSESDYTISGNPRCRNATGNFSTDFYTVVLRLGYPPLFRFSVTSLLRPHERLFRSTK